MNDFPPDNTPRLILGRFRPVDLARLLFVIVPCVPGLIFLAVGLAIDPHWAMQKPATPPTQAEWARAAAQARGLYLAGAVTLLAGTLGMAAVIWKIARTHPEEEEIPTPGSDA